MKSKPCLTFLLIAALMFSLSACADTPISQNSVNIVTPPKVVSNVPAPDLRFPGPVSSEDKRLSNVERVIDTTVVDYSYMKTWFPPETWRSTGLYAPPGETITLTLAEGEDTTGLYVQIGSHTDTLESLVAYDRLRAGEICVKKPLISGSNEISNPYGGLIYIIPTQITHQPILPHEDPSKALAKVIKKTTMNIKISGAIEAPYFKLGATTPEEWQKSLSSSSAPMCELASDNIILTVPSQAAKDIKDPTALMTVWEDFATKTNALAGYTDTPTNQGLAVHVAPRDPWRYVADIQISYGYMYAGYPIMLYDDASVKDMLDVTRFKTNGWGFWHELGHNYQQNLWEVPSLVEVTNNVYSLYFENLYKNPPRLEMDNDGNGLSSYDTAKNYLALPRDEKNYHSDEDVSYFTRLVLFDQLINQYGFEAFTELNRRFRTFPSQRDLSSDSLKIEAFAEVLEGIIGEDARGFLEEWGFM